VGAAERGRARAQRPLLAYMLGGGLLGCGPPPDAGLRDVQQVLRERTDAQTIYRRDEVRREAVLENTLLALLRMPLTERSAVKVALLNNPGLQAELARLGIAAADLHQAGLAENPRLWGAVRFPAQGAVVTDVMGGLSTSFLSLFTITARERVAEARLEVETLAVSHIVLRTVAEVRTAFVEVQRRQQKLAVLRALRATLGDEPSLAALDDELALRELALEGDVVAARETMNRHLGLWTPTSLAWSVAAPLPTPPRQKLRVGSLERTAVAQRLDLQSARARTRMIGRTLQMRRDWGWLGDLDLGASVNRPTTGDGVTVGPAASVGLPIFDQGQAAVARLEAAHARSRHQATALAVAIRSEVRQLRAALGRARRRVSLVGGGPLARAEASAEALADDPLSHARAQVTLLDAYFAHLDARADYWRLRHQLVRACGGVLPP